MSNFIKKHPAISILILSQIIGLGMIAPIAAGLVPSDSAFFLIAAFSASLAGVILTAIVSGKDGLRELFRRLLIWRVGIGWWAFALFALGLMFLGGMVLAALFSGSALNLSLTQPLYMFIPLLFIRTLTDSGLGEELGWRGFLLPRLQARYSALVAAIIVGVVWGLWHWPLLLMEGLPPYYEFGQMYGFIPGILAIVFFITVPWSILFTWMGNNTKGSLLLACVFHGSQAWFMILVDPANMMIPYLGYMAIMTVTAIVVVLISGAKNLSRMHERIMLQDA
jgi:membrane protease YdiL (CAAX protease family)